MFDHLCSSRVTTEAQAGIRGWYPNPHPVPNAQMFDHFDKRF